MTPRRSAVVRYIDAGTNRMAFATGRATDQTRSCDRLRGDLQAPFDSDDAGGGVVNAGTDCSPYPTSDDDRWAALILSAVPVSRGLRPGIAKCFADVQPTVSLLVPLGVRERPLYRLLADGVRQRLESTSLRAVPRIRDQPRDDELGRGLADGPESRLIVDL